MQSLKELIETVSRSVVTVISRPFSVSDYMQGKVIQGGSGFCISKGLIITNLHVVEGTKEVQILTKDTISMKARVTHTNPINDLALLESDVEIPTLKVSDSVNVGDFVIVLGSPFLFDLGDLTVSFGIISSVNREIKSPFGYNMYVYQTDAAVNPGNSGGPVINMKGQVVGVAQSHLDKSENINFLVPSRSLQSFLFNVSKNGDYFAPFTGIGRVRVINKVIGRYLSLEVDYGLMIQEILRESPADRAGLMVGDVILSANGIPMRTTIDLWDASERVAPGFLNLVVVRHGKKYSAKLEVEGRKIS